MEVMMELTVFAVFVVVCLALLEFLQSQPEAPGFVACERGVDEI